MPLAIGFLYVLGCSDVLPEEARLKGGYKILLGVLFSFCALTAIYAGILGISEFFASPGGGSEVPHHHGVVN